jgi:arylsulfatase A-like enzyme
MKLLLFMLGHDIKRMRQNVVVNRRSFLATTAAATVARTLRGAQAQGRERRPNIVILYADDVGWGDLSCYGATRVKTPNLDRLAAAGLRFTDAHSSAATCTPSRYSLLTGRYAFRNERARVLPGDAPLLIEPGSPTLPALLKQQGYRTGVVGKWHLGLGEGDVDWNGEIKPGPREVGFDYSFLIPATGDRVPTVYVENQRVVGLDPKDPIQVDYKSPVGDEPTGKNQPEMLKVKPSHGHDFTIVNGISRIGYMSGGKAARWVDEDMADTITRKAVDFINSSKSDPFFLYFSTHDIHVPRVPNKRFAGRTPMGPRGDVIAELDWCVGQILDALDRNGLASSTMVIFSSDNGPVIDDGYQDDAVAKLGAHKPAGPFRGGKYSNFEGGTRVPFILRWPGRVKPGVSDALISQMDLPVSLAHAAGYTAPAVEGADVFDALVGTSQTGRDHLVLQASNLTLREGKWKYLPPSKGQAIQVNTNTETGNSPEPQLYDLAADPGERRNLAQEHPERVARMSAMLERIRKVPANKG